MRRSSGASPARCARRDPTVCALPARCLQHFLHTCRPPIIHRDLKSPNLVRPRPAPLPGKPGCVPRHTATGKKQLAGCHEL